MDKRDSTITLKSSNQKDSNIVKIAVEMSGQVPQLAKFDQKQPLTGIIQELCNGWGLTNAESYALKFTENNNQNYITEKNRNEVKNGSVLRLEFSPSKIAADILSKLVHGDATNKGVALQQLSTLSTDVTFASEFIKEKGLDLIISQVEGGKLKNFLAYSLQSFVELMEHGTVSWDILESTFINKVASYVNNQTAVQDHKVIEASLSILENIVLNSSSKYNQVEKEVTYPNLSNHLQSSSPQIQQNTLALINALLLKADIAKRRAVAATLQSKHIRNLFLNNIINSSKPVGAEMAHQLYVFQCLMLNLLEQRMTTKMDPQDQDAHEKIKELRKIAFDTDGTTGGDVSARKQGLFAKDYKKLGFKYDINPAMDFNEIPPGMLALDCMIYFARNHTENYTKVVLENSCRADEHECPFGRTSVELVKLICEVLRIGEAPSEQGKSYHAMFFTHEHPFEELYCVCIVLLNKTWKEMKATTEDFVKVFSVVREQITRALQSKPTDLENFKSLLQQLPYSAITNLWQQERTSREEFESQAKPMVELREQITPEILELIQQQRLGYLVEGTRFTKYSARGQRVKDKFWYIRLSPNYKVFHYGDCDEKSVPTIDELQTKLPVVEIRGLLTGRDCPHMKDLQRRKTTHILAFSLMLDSVEVSSLDFVASDEQVYDYWIDGINALLYGKNHMASKEKEKDLEILLAMEIRLRLLDADNIDIPQDPPPIPDLPPNYDFFYDLQ